MELARPGRETSNRLDADRLFAILGEWNECLKQNAGRQVSDGGDRRAQGAPYQATTRPDWALRAGCDLPAFTSVEAFQTEVEGLCGQHFPRRGLEDEGRLAHK